MASVYDKYYEKQPGAVKVIVAAGLGLLGWSIYRSIKRKQDEAESLRAAQAAADELAQLQNQGVHPSYGDSQFEVFATKLVEAMTDCGTDETQVYDVFKQLRNNADIRKLISVFGVRYYTPCAALSPISYAIWQLDHKAYSGDLAYWLNYDLSEGEVGYINSILRGNGIDYQF